jgi:hypothetical protein
LDIRVIELAKRHDAAIARAESAESALYAAEALLADERNPNCENSLAFELAEATQLENEAREKFHKAAEWNRLTVLEMENLRSLNAGLVEDSAALKVERYQIAEQCAKLQLRVNELLASLEEVQKERDSANKRALHHFTAHGTLDEYRGKIEALETSKADLRTMLLELCEKIEAGISGAEETKRARAHLSNIQ